MLDRRTFFKSAAVAGMGLLGVGFLPASTPSPWSRSPDWIDAEGHSRFFIRRAGDFDKDLFPPQLPELPPGFVWSEQILRVDPPVLVYREGHRFTTQHFEHTITARETRK